MQLGRGQGNGLEVRDGVGRWKFTSQGWEARWEVVIGVRRGDRGNGFGRRERCTARHGDGKCGVEEPSIRRVKEARMRGRSDW